MNDNSERTNVHDLTMGIEIVQGHNVLAISGDIDVYSAPQLKQSLNNMLDESIQHLIIDMHDVLFMDSTGIGILLSAVKRLNPRGGTVNLVGCSPTIDRILSITMVSKFIASYKNMDDAMKAIFD